MDNFLEYGDKVRNALNTVDKASYGAVFNIIVYCMENKIPILTMGNGGSASLAGHAAADLMKIVAIKCPVLRPLLYCLTDNISLVTAISNDLNYSEVFAEQIRYTNFKEALVLAISSSGNSPNILKGLDAAEVKGYYTAALVGFEGGKVLQEKLASAIIHVKDMEYEVCEDCHSIILHSISQEIVKRWKS